MKQVYRQSNLAGHSSRSTFALHLLTHIWRHAFYTTSTLVPFRYCRRQACRSYSTPQRASANHVRITATSRMIKTKINIQMHHPLFVSACQRGQGYSTLRDPPSLRRIKSFIFLCALCSFELVLSTLFPRSSSILWQSAKKPCLGVSGGAKPRCDDAPYVESPHSYVASERGDNLKSPKVKRLTHSDCSLTSLPIRPAWLARLVNVPEMKPSVSSCLRIKVYRQLTCPLNRSCTLSLPAAPPSPSVSARRRPRPLFPDPAGCRYSPLAVPFLCPSDLP